MALGPLNRLFFWQPLCIRWWVLGVCRVVVATGCYHGCYNDMTLVLKVDDYIWIRQRDTSSNLRIQLAITRYCHTHRITCPELALRWKGNVACMTLVSLCSLRKDHPAWFQLLQAFKKLKTCSVSAKSNMSYMGMRRVSHVWVHTFARSVYSD